MAVEATSEVSVLAVKLHKERVIDHGFKLSGSSRSFETGSMFRLPRSTMAYSSFVQGIAVLWSDLLHKNPSLASEISIAEREDALFTDFVLALGSERKSQRQSGDKAGKTTINLAEEYLRTHLTQPVSRAELAATLGVSIRTLSREFVKRWGTGPMGFLRIQRMEAAYRELLGNEPDATSVTEVAHRYGFTHLGKFSVEYKRAFHESPSETLRH